MKRFKNDGLPTITISKKSNALLRLRFSYGKQQYELSFAVNEDIGWLKAATAKQLILSDIKLNAFDKSLSKYKLSEPQSDNKLTEISPIDYLQYFKQYLEEKGFLLPQLATDSEFSTFQMVKRWKIDTYTDIRNCFLSMNYAGSTFTYRLIILKKWCNWMVQKKLIPNDPVKNIKYKKRYSMNNPLREPLPDGILLEVVEAIRQDKFKSRLARYKDSVYYAPIMFMLFTGWRPQEAIGLRCKYVDFKNKVIHIKEVLAKRRGYSSHKNLIRKQPKTEAGNRFIPIAEEICELLLSCCINKLSDELVFLSQNSLSVDPRRMCGVWKKYLQKSGYPAMDLYGIRHAFGTRWNEQGLNPVNGAETMGHADVAVFFNTYSHRSRDGIKRLPKISY